jgi:tRNA (uracil-5-)-methyltransferase
VVNEGLMRQRALAKTTTYARGATLLCRESLGSSKWADEATDTATELISTEPSKICITDHKAIVTEQVGKYTFKFPAGTPIPLPILTREGSFFQNNNAILPDFTGYVRDQLLSSAGQVGLTDKPKYLVDAYCGSGLFSITCAEGFETVTGVEITADSVKWATQNAELNNLPNATFITGSADEIFKHVKTPPDQTAVIIDPPRKVRSFLSVES